MINKTDLEQVTADVKTYSHRLYIKRAEHLGGVPQYFIAHNGTALTAARHIWELKQAIHQHGVKALILRDKLASSDEIAAITEIPAQTHEEVWSNRDLQGLADAITGLDGVKCGFYIRGDKKHGFRSYDLLTHTQINEPVMSADELVKIARDAGYLP